MKTIAVSSLVLGALAALAFLAVSPPAPTTAISVAVPLSPRPAGPLVRSGAGRLIFPPPTAATSPSPSGFAAFAEWADRDPAAAAAWLRTHPARADHQQALAAALSRWLRIDPRAAADFALSLPASPDRAQALELVATNWSAADPAALSRWAESLPPSAELDPVAAAIATLPALASTDAEKAIGWADTILNPELREQSFAYIIAATETPHGNG